MTTFRVALTSRDPSHAVDSFYKYQAEHLPKPGAVIEVVRFVRGRPIPARVTRVDPHDRPEIQAEQIAPNPLDETVDRALDEAIKRRRAEQLAAEQARAAKTNPLDGKTPQERLAEEIANELLGEASRRATDR